MTVSHVEVLVEEPSAEAALQSLLPRMLGELTFAVYPHACKDELLQRLPERLRGYAAWLPDDWRIVIIVDRDDDDCAALKRRLEQMALVAGLSTRANRHGARVQVVNRLAIEELEAWFFGDWEAVRAAYPKVDGNIPQQAKYRSADAIQGGTWEAFERVLKKAGYFQTGLRKIEAARAVATHMDPERNASPSFRTLRSALLEITQS
ncbi:DUF4276 family protein [Myxococcota bacterium]|nr:DUF4276 family protein [Myxococcota bacterium]